MILSPRLKKKQIEEARGTMKLDAIFAPMRFESFDEKTEIKIRGMGDIQLKPQVIGKSSFDHNKLDEVHDQRRIARQQISMPDKPAKFKKPKPKPLPKEPSPVKEPSPEKPFPLTPPVNDEPEVDPLPEALMSEIDPLPLELPSEIELPRPDALEILERKI